MRPGAERNLSGWVVREAVSEISAAREETKGRASKPASRSNLDGGRFTVLS